MMTETPTSTPFHIKGHWLLLARSIWIILSLVTIAIFIAGVNKLYTGWHQPCNTYALADQADCFKKVQTYAAFGLTRDFFGNFFSIGVAVEMLPWILVGVLIFWKKSDEPFGLLFSLMLVVAGTLNLDTVLGVTLLYYYPILQPVLDGMWFIGESLLIFWYCFPDGRFVPRWLRWVAVLWVLLEAGDQFAPVDSILKFTNWPYPASEWIIILFAASIIFSLIYRYRHTFDPLQKQQIKWVVLSASIFSVMRSIQNLVSLLIVWGMFTWNDNVAVIWFLTYSPLFYLSSLFVAVSLGFSILRYRLWDIDFIINRSLVYGALTILLAIIFGSSLLIVSLFVQGQSLVIAFGVTAMIGGTSFNPTRRRIQRFVDQRFYNIQIDYQKTPPGLATAGQTQVLRQTHFGQYQNLELIGRGGMAEVYKSTHPTQGTTVAIKILPTALAAETEFRQRFAREAQVISTLVHPNIVRIFDSGVQDGQLYMVMEYLTGKDLDQLIKTSGRLPLAQALPIVQQIAAALDYAHAAGFVHRDIKPSNVLLEASSTDSLRAVLTDFGIAKINNAHTAMTSTGYMLGTFDYVAPEQIQESSAVDGRADIYALGVMVYQMLTGQLPFKHSNPGALLIAHLTQPPPDACEHLPDLPPQIGIAIQRAMAKKPQDRFATATDFALAMG
jgi:serine/threonine-protein kinase